MAERLTAARPYAVAVFELAQVRAELKAWSQTLAVAAAVATDAAMMRLAFDPRVSRRELAEVFTDVCKKAGAASAEASNLFQLLIENRRLTLLPEIARLYEELRGAAEGTIEAEVVSAVALSVAQQAAMAAGLKQRLQREVKLHTRIDPALVGGAVIRAGDLVIDGSVRGRLERLAAELIQ